MKIKIFIILIIFTVSVFCISADSYWEGAASMSRYGEFPVNGFYGASNSFPLNSIVEVSNPSNGKKAEIIIVNKLDDNNLFLLISKDAAEKLSIKEDSIVTVKAQIVKKFDSDDETEKELTDDPDFNPSSAALFDDEKDKSALEEETIEEIPVEIVEETAGGERDLRDEIIESLIISDIPRKYEEAEETVETDDEEEVEITALIIPDDVPEDLSETDEAPEEELLEEYNPDALVITDTEEKTADESDTEIIAEGDFEEKLVLVPASPKPPENGEFKTYEEVIIEPDFTEYSSSSDPVNTLDINSYYLQIGAFKDFNSADQLALRMNIDYPVFLYKKGENGIYRVMAGPLKNDEKGAALYQVRIKGVKDAFIRKGE